MIWLFYRRTYSSIYTEHHGQNSIVMELEDDADELLIQKGSVIKASLNGHWDICTPYDTIDGKASAGSSCNIDGLGREIKQPSLGCYTKAWLASVSTHDNHAQHRTNSTT